jgi:DIE2/ALG10 family
MLSPSYRRDNPLYDITFISFTSKFPTPIDIRAGGPLVSQPSRDSRSAKRPGSSRGSSKTSKPKAKSSRKGGSDHSQRRVMPAESTNSESSSWRSVFNGLKSLFLMTEKSGFDADYWMGLNVSLFPLLFFFSALYYTDVWSTYMVLLAYNYSLGSKNSSGNVTYYSLKWVIFSLLALLFRQTNIFWVAVFAGGMQAVRLLKEKEWANIAIRSPSLSDGLPDEQTDQNPSLIQVLTDTWSEDKLYDPCVEDAFIEGWRLRTIYFRI